MPTVISVLSGNLGHGVADLLAGICDGLAGQAGHELLTDDQPLLAGEGREELLGLVRDGVFSCLGRDSSEENGGERTCLGEMQQ